MHGPWYWLNFDEFVARRTADFVMRRISLKQFSPLTSGFWRTLGYKLKHLFNNTLKPWAWESSSLEYFLDSLSLTHRIAKLEQSYADVLSGNVPSIVDPSKLPESPTQPEVQKVMSLSAESDLSIKPPIPWMGGKRWMNGTVADLYRRSGARSFVDLFFGGGGVTLGVRPEIGIAVDNNRNTVNLYQQIQQGHTPSFPYPQTREGFFSAKEELNSLIAAGQRARGI